jgi:hypothetical protein
LQERFDDELKNKEYKVSARSPQHSESINSSDNEKDGESCKSFREDKEEMEKCCDPHLEYKDPQRDFMKDKLILPCGALKLKRLYYHIS